MRKTWFDRVGASKRRIRHNASGETRARFVLHRKQKLKVGHCHSIQNYSGASHWSWREVTPICITKDLIRNRGTRVKRVSVIIPTYKRSRFLRRAIESVLLQDYPSIEVVVVDDNEPDSVFRLETERLMSLYANDNRVLYIKNSRNLGGALARNEGIRAATGDYITFLDDDDIYLPQKVSVQISFMEKNNLEVSFSDVRIHDSRDKLIDYREHSYVQTWDNKELLKLHLMHHLTPTATYMFQRESLLRIGGFDDVAMGQEYILMLKAITSGLRIGYLPQAFVIQYIHDGERISVGQTKLDKEKELYRLKQTYFNYLTRKERRYVRFRHYAVMVISGKRSGEFSICLQYLFRMFVTSPIYCVYELYSHFRRIAKHRKASPSRAE